MVTIKKGLKLPIKGEITDFANVSAKEISAKKVAILGNDFHDLKPLLKVEIGETVKKGQVLFVDKRDEKICFVAPVSGTVLEINRGDKRKLLSVVIENDNTNNEIEFPTVLTKDNIKEQLLNSSLWNSFRTRPFDKIPASNSECAAIFVTAIDTNPLALNPRFVIDKDKDNFDFGIQVLAKINKVFICQDENEDLTRISENIEIRKFKGVHPAGLAGTHIHFTLPVSQKRTVWHLNYQAVIAIGKLFKTGKLDFTKVITVAGNLKEPFIARVTSGIHVNELVNVENTRIISGSVFGGTWAKGVESYLGNYHLQISLIKEEQNREFLSYLRAGFEKHSVMNINASKFIKNKLFDFTTTLNGSYRAMVPVGNYEEVFPLDILPTQLLRAVIVGDLEEAEQLGVLELAEEDLSLCSYVCAGKYEYGPILRNILTQIQKENS